MGGKKTMLGEFFFGQDVLGQFLPRRLPPPLTPPLVTPPPLPRQLPPPTWEAPPQKKSPNNYTRFIRGKKIR